MFTGIITDIGTIRTHEQRGDLRPRHVDGYAMLQLGFSVPPQVQHHLTRRQFGGVGVENESVVRLHVECRRHVNVSHGLYRLSARCARHRPTGFAFARRS